MPNTPYVTIDRAAVKQQARGFMREGRPSLLTAGLVYTLLGLLVSFLSLQLTGIDNDTAARVMQRMAEGNTDAAMTLLTRAMPGPGESLISFLLRLAMGFVGVGFVIFTLNTVRRSGPVLGNLLDGFGMPLRVLGVLVLQYVFIALWSLLFVIPGIIAAYRYSLAVYIMIDRPELSAMDCIRESKRLTNGYKMQLFTLDLSFILWIILSSLPVIGYAVDVWLTPYRSAAKALYYEQIRRGPEPYFDPYSV